MNNHMREQRLTECVTRLARAYERRTGVPNELDWQISQMFERLGCGDLAGMLGLFDRNWGPTILFTLSACDGLTPDLLRQGLCHAWTMVELPLAHIPRETWISWFRSAGFVSDSDRPRPVAPVEVWRAQRPGVATGMAWTSSRDVAVWFADRYRGASKGCRVLHGHVPPSQVLAFVDGRDEREVVVDPTRRFWMASGKS